MEHINTIEIKNFKSIRHQKIEGCKRINLLIGKPNVGKSNILEAVSGFVYAHDEKPNFKDLCRYENSADLIFNGDIGSNHSTNVIFNTDIDFNLKYQTNNKINVSGGVRPSGELSISHINEDFLEKAKGGFRFDIENGVPQKQYSFPTTDFPIVKKYDFNKFRKNATVEFESSLTVPYGDNLSDIIEFDNVLRRTVADLFKDYSLKLVIDKGSRTIRVLKELDEETIFTIPFTHIADTLQRLVFFLSANASNKNTVLLFEEPESHMFPPYINNFTSKIIYDENNNQYFIATHSPYVFNNFIEDAKKDLAIYLVDYQNGETLIYKMTDDEMYDAYQFGYDFFMNIENFLPQNTHEQI